MNARTSHGARLLCRPSPRVGPVCLTRGRHVFIPSIMIMWPMIVSSSYLLSSSHFLLQVSMKTPPDHHVLCLGLPFYVRLHFDLGLGFILT